jgi:hypothetical protein
MFIFLNSAIFTEKTPVPNKHRFAFPDPEVHKNDAATQHCSDRLV